MFPPKARSDLLCIQILLSQIPNSHISRSQPSCPWPLCIKRYSNSIGTLT
ncbi:unnamed protein product [Prunus brigantina]